MGKTLKHYVLVLTQDYGLPHVLSKLFRFFCSRFPFLLDFVCPCRLLPSGGPAKFQIVPGKGLQRI